MEKELQGKLVEILTSIQAGVGQAKDFALSQLPDIAQSYIAYGRAAYTFGIVLAALAFAAGVLIVMAGVRAVKASKQEYRDKNGGRDPRYNFETYDGLAHFFPGAILCAIGPTVFALLMPSALLVWLAPKVWLLKELASLVK